MPHRSCTASQHVGGKQTAGDTGALTSQDLRSLSNSSTEANSLTSPRARASSTSRSFACHSGVQNQSWSLGIRLTGTISTRRSTRRIRIWSPFLRRKALAIRRGIVTWCLAPTRRASCKNVFALGMVPPGLEIARNCPSSGHRSLRNVG